VGYRIPVSGKWALDLLHDLHKQCASSHPYASHKLGRTGLNEARTEELKDKPQLAQADSLTLCIEFPTSTAFQQASAQISKNFSAAIKWSTTLKELHQEMLKRINFGIFLGYREIIKSRERFLFFHNLLSKYEIDMNFQREK
jgi:hypothetical protein